MVLLKEGASKDTISIKPYEAYKLNTDDILNITVASTDASSISIFTKHVGGSGSGMISEGMLYMNGFRVGDKGEIIFPIIGELQAKGKTITELRDLIQLEMSKYFKFAVVDVKLTNFRISFLGEVTGQGTHIIYRDKINLVEGLALAGGFTDLAKRREVKIFRVIDGVTYTKTVDFTSSEIINHEWYYLMPNDVVYVEPVKLKVLKTNSSTFSMFVSVFSFALVLITLGNRK